MTDAETLDRVVELTESRFFGKYRGLVVDNNDPTGRGRLKVKVPGVMGQTAVWALPCVALAGPAMGLFTLPDIGTTVWVEFEQGEASYPIWVGCFWKDGDIPQADARPGLKFLTTGKVSIRVDDDEGSIEISTGSGCSLKLTATDIELKAQSINASTGAKKIALSAASFDVNDGAFTVV